jgi:hypothetical protein
MAKALLDPDLAALASDLGLDCPADQAEWEQRLRGRLEQEVYADLLEARVTYGERGAALPPDFFQLVGSDADLNLMMLEGRLGYYDAALPLVAQAVAGVPHGAILEMASYGGLAALYLGRRFPGSRVIAIDRCAGLIERSRELAAKAGVGNVTFVHGDYNRDDPGGPFDVVVSLQGMPIYLLPWLPSESPESYRRGDALNVVAADPILPARRVAQALASVGRLARAGGHAVLHERLPEVSRALLFVLLACKAGLRVRQTRPVVWESPAESLEGPRVSPLMVAECLGRAVPFDEAAVIESYLPRPSRLAPLVPPRESNRAMVLSGHEAQAHFEALPAGRRSLRVRSATSDDKRIHVHLGVAGRLAYAYSCNDHDYRELKVADAGMARSLFGSVVESLARLQRSGQAAVTDPEPAALPAMLDALLGQS